MKGIINNTFVDVICGGAGIVDLWKIASGEAGSRWTANEVISRMLVSIRCLLPSRNSSLKNRIDADPAVWIKRCTFAIDFAHWKIFRINSTTKSKVQVEIDGLIVDDCARQSRSALGGGENPTLSPSSPNAIRAWCVQ